MGSLIGRGFPLMERGARWITPPFKKRHIMTPYKNNAPYIQPDIRRWKNLSKNWENSIVILQKVYSKKFHLSGSRAATSFENPSAFQVGKSKVRAKIKNNITI